MANGGLVSTAISQVPRTFYGACDRKTRSVTVVSGQVLKKHTLLESDGAGKVKAHSGIGEAAFVTFTGALTAGQTLIMAGLTWTAGGSGTTVAQLVTAWENIASGTGFADLATRTGGGSFTAGTLTAYATETYDSNTVVFNAATAETNATDVAATGTGAAVATITIKAGTTTTKKVVGVLCFDVNAASSDVDASAYSEVSMFPEGIVWATDANDTIENADGTTTACTSYNTGASGTSKASYLLKQKLLEGSEIELAPFTYSQEEQNI